jgi:uroporphyrinogen decarboxylase
MAMAYARLKEYLGIRSGNIYIYDLPQQLAIVEPAVLDELGIDVVEMGRGFMTDDREWKDWVLPDGKLCKIPNYIRVEERRGDWYLLAKDGGDLAVRKRGNPFMEQIHFPMATAISKMNHLTTRRTIQLHMWTGVATPMPVSRGD